MSVYRDYDHYAGWYTTLGVSQAVPLTDKIALSLGAQVGYLAADAANSYAKVGTTEAYKGFHDGLLSASIAIPLDQHLTVTPALNYSFPLTSAARDLIKVNSQEFLNGDSEGKSDFLYGGVTITLGF